ncbi:uncharacterized protein LOC113383687 [Ctenocephalides felis]|uniref:uncharacterized protein LOC113383687 n=1 Tax=Ctenocephalides felis TaxID=7515 RepID=UPI000E6E3C80|nr:uncharacterized protein LOC113383687 [Ctenocephalides felis]
MEVDISEDLKHLHLLTIKFTIGNDSSIANDLCDVIRNIDEDTLLLVKPHILMEICKSLKLANNSDRKIELIKVAKVLLDKTPGGALQQGGFFNVLSGVISSDIKLTSEELFVSALDCLLVITTKCPLDIKQCMFIKMNAPFLGKSIYAASQLARKHASAEIKYLALKFISSICNIDDWDLIATEAQQEFRSRIAEVLMFFLPGLVSACQEIALQNIKKQHRVTVIALQIWGRAIAIVMEDEKKTENEVLTANDFLKLVNPVQVPGEKSAKDWSKAGKSDLIEYLNESKRSTKWMQEASSKIAKLFPHLTPIITHEHPEVRLMLVSCCELILKYAWNNCGICNSDLLVILFSLSRDENQKIAQVSESILQSIIKERGAKTVVRVIEGVLHKRISDIPNLINTIDERALMSSLDFLIGVSSCLGKLADEIFTLQTQERLLDVLTVVIQIDIAAVSLDESTSELVLLSDNLVLLRSYPGLYEGSLEIRYTDMSITNDDENKDQLFSEFCKNLHEVKYNTLLIALQCEAVGSMAIVMGEDFRHFFLKYLYLIIERCGHRRQCIRNSAFSAAKDLQTFSKVGSFSELIEVNADYLINSISVKLNHIIHYNAPNTGVLDALVIVIENCKNPKHLRSFADVLTKLEELDFKQKDVIISLLKVYKAFVKQLALVHSTYSVASKKVEPCSTSNLLHSIKELQQAIQTEQDENMIDVENFNESEAYELTSDACMEEDVEKKLPPDHVTLVSAILKRSIPFVSSENNYHRLLSLDIVHAALPLLSEHEDTLLPALHEIWNPVASRMRGRTDAELSVLRKSFSVACALASFGKDFLRQRAIGSVLANALNFLLSNAQETKSKAECSEAYRHTQVFKLQLEILSGLGELCYNLQFGEKTRFEVMAAIYRYLHENAISELREAAKNAFIRMAKDNPADVAHFLATIWPLQTLSCDLESFHLQNFSTSVLEIERTIYESW